MYKKLILIAALVVAGYTGLTSHQEVVKSPSRGIASVTGSQAARKAYSFNFKDLSKKSFQIKKEANSYEEAFKLASHDCFQLLTQGKYPGEEKGLDIIDICVNPKI